MPICVHERSREVTLIDLGPLEALSDDDSILMMCSKLHNETLNLKNAILIIETSTLEQIVSIY